MNATCAILDANIGEVFDTSTAEAIVTQIISEFVAVAEKEGVHLDPAAMRTQKCAPVLESTQFLRCKSILLASLQHTHLSKDLKKGRYYEQNYPFN